MAADEGNEIPVTCHLYIRTYGADENSVRTHEPETVLDPGANYEFEWQIGDAGGAPIAEIGVEISSAQRAEGTLTWTV